MYTNSISTTSKRRHVVGLAALLILLGHTAGLVIPKSQASGSVGVGSASHDDYNFGKVVVFRKLACERCPYPGRGQDAEDARRLIDELTAGTGSPAAFSEKERAAAVSYLKRRFKLEG